MYLLILPYGTGVLPPDAEGLVGPMPIRVPNLTQRLLKPLGSLANCKRVDSGCSSYGPRRGNMKNSRWLLGLSIVAPHIPTKLRLLSSSFSQSGPKGSLFFSTEWDDDLSSQKTNTYPEIFPWYSKPVHGKSFIDSLCWQSDENLFVMPVFYCQIKSNVSVVV